MMAISWIVTPCNCRIHEDSHINVGFEAVTAAVMKSSVF
jgi:hypothetical protein